MTGPGGAAGTGASGSTAAGGVGTAPGAGAGRGVARGGAGRSATVVVAPVVMATVNNKLTALGDAKAEQSVTVVAQDTGQIDKILVQPGQTIRWTNRDPGNSHTVTSYHPSLFERPRRIPEGATSFDSDYLLPDESFSLTLSLPGVYDYYCVPHEHAGMVGRIVVGTPGAGFAEYADAGVGLTQLPEAALAGFPEVAAIVAAGAVHRE